MGAQNSKLTRDYSDSDGDLKLERRTFNINEFFSNYFQVKWTDYERRCALHLLDLAGWIAKSKASYENQSKHSSFCKNEDNSNTITNFTFQRLIKPIESSHCWDWTKKELKERRDCILSQIFPHNSDLNRNQNSIDGFGIHQKILDYIFLQYDYPFTEEIQTISLKKYSNFFPPCLVLITLANLFGSSNKYINRFLYIFDESHDKINMREFMNRMVELLLMDFENIILETPKNKYGIQQQCFSSTSSISSSVSKPFLVRDIVKNTNDDGLKESISKRHLKKFIFYGIPKLSKDFSFSLKTIESPPLSPPIFPPVIRTSDDEEDELFSLLDGEKVFFICQTLGELNVHPPQWIPLYSTSVHGRNWTLFMDAVLYSGPTILVIKPQIGNIFGAYCSNSWVSCPTFYGSPNCFIFSFGFHDSTSSSRENLGTPYFSRHCPTNNNDHYQYLSYGMKTLNNGIGMGGQIDFFGWFIQSDLMHGVSESSCSTFHGWTSRITGRLEREFLVDILEVYALDPSSLITKRDTEREKRESAMIRHGDVMNFLNMTRAPISESRNIKEEEKHF